MTEGQAVTALQYFKTLEGIWKEYHGGFISPEFYCNYNETKSLRNKLPKTD